MIIRKIEKRDLEDFMILAKQLGYEVDKKYVADCIDNQESSEIVFVAEEQKVLGWIIIKITKSFISKPYGEIVAFIVDENNRKKGIGKSLLREAELWGKMKGLPKIVLYSNIKRLDAHRFYEHNDYKYIKDSKLFRNEII